MYLELLSHKEYDSKMMLENSSATDLIKIKTKSYNKSDILNYMMQFDINNYLVDDILVKVDRAAMTNSLETRAPFLDRDIVEFSINLDSSYKIRNGSSKWILKQILKKNLPINYFNRPKKGFGVPLSNWIRNDLKALSLKLLDKKLIERQSIFNFEIINNLLQNHLSKKQNNQYMLWNLIVFQNWYLKNFNE